MKKNEISTVTVNPLATIDTVALADRFGYDTLHTVREDNGKVAVSVYDKDGKEVVTSLETMSDENLASLNFIESISNINEVSPILLAWHIMRLRDFADDCGFSSVGAYVSEQLNGRIKPNYANQLANVAEKFLEVKDGDTLPSFRYDWCKSVPVSNLALILGEYNKCGDELSFREKFIDCDNPLPLRNQSKLKEALKASRGTDSKSKKEKGEQGEQGEQGEKGERTMSLALAYSMVIEDLRKDLARWAKDPAKYDGADDAIHTLENLIKGLEVMSENK